MRHTIVRELPFKFNDVSADIGEPIAFDGPFKIQEFVVIDVGKQLPELTVKASCKLSIHFVNSVSALDFCQDQN